MILLNFSHPLTSEQVSQIERLTNQKVDVVHELPAQFDSQADFLPQMHALMDRLPLSANELQTAPILVNLPSLNFIAALVLANLHGRMGYFPPVIRLRPVTESLPPRYEVSEILNLQGVRDSARKQRF